MTTSERYVCWVYIYALTVGITLAGLTFVVGLIWCGIRAKRTAQEAKTEYLYTALAHLLVIVFWFCSLKLFLKGV